MAIFQFFLPPEKLIEEKKKYHAHQKIFMIFDHIFKKIHQNPNIFYYIKFCDAFAKLESENFHNFINKKLGVSIFVTNRFERY